MYFISCITAPLQWMGAIRMRVQTVDKNITIIHKYPHHSSPSIKVLLSKKLSLCAKQIHHKDILSPLSLILLSSVKRSSCLNQERNMHRPSTLYKWKQLQTNMSVDFDVKGQQRMDFFTGGSVIMNYGLILWICFLQTQDAYWWMQIVQITIGLLWCFYQLFGLLFWRHPFTAEDPLVRKWCNATFLQIFYEETNSSTFSFLCELF